jgi:hypothetical protein
MNTGDSLQEKLRKIETLFAGGATAGEKAAAGAAAERIRARLGKAARGARPEEIRFSVADSWSRQLFIALCAYGGRVPSRGAEHPRAFALAPGGDSGAVPTTMAIRAGAEWPLQRTPVPRNVPLKHYNCLSTLPSAIRVCVSETFYRVYCTKGQCLAIIISVSGKCSRSAPITMHRYLSLIDLDQSR